MEVEEVGQDRIADGGASAGNGDDGDMDVPNGKAENSEPAKVKRKFLNRRERKSLPSKEEIAQQRYTLLDVNVTFQMPNCRRSTFVQCCTISSARVS